MGKRTRRPGEHLRGWRTSQEPHVTQASLGLDVGVDGSAIRHFENGRVGFSLSLNVKVKLALRTGLPLQNLVSKEELALARELVAVMARDAAA